MLASLAFLPQLVSTMSNKDVVCQRCSNNDANLRQCGRCYAVYYCSKLCQSVDWPHHKAICVDNRQSHNKNKEAGPQSYSKDMETRNLPITKEKTLKSTDMPSTHKGNGSAGKPAKPKTIGKYPCEHCRSPGASKKCARCQTVAYCSRQCQKADWTNHKCKCEQKNLKETLTLKLTEEEERIIKVHQERDLEAKDAKDEESKVEFYLDQYHDDPSPFFRYSQIKPGGYICLKNPVIHHFLDRTYGFRVNNPDEVKVLEMQIDRK
ncbi:N-lysine methyltransferase SMYD2-like isoform X3 [Mercenaria mercenaria]|uniref:N-lysine methyltransferase SMYD2-like isoform X3 n=1 Tax=Mercenaria mercenaria TaxID=6596 RepID=UPI00234E819B|nr:N-lysine methyltransferase SMYD2-like isoform X3 [Mercenaria mercenaria]